MKVTAALAEFSAGLGAHSIPRPVLDNALLAISDSIGTVFAGLDQTSVRLIREAAMREGAAGPATVMGTGMTSSATAAALANGSAAHALDYDNISLTVSGFIGSPTLFALLALAEASDQPIGGTQLLEAYVAGWEAAAAIARGLGVLHYSKGWHATATIGHFGAAIGGARLLGLDPDRTRSAIGIAASEASGLRTMIGNMTNPFHVGKAARNGVLAAQLAAAGFEAERDVIEHPFGVAVAFNGRDGFDLSAMTQGLGERWDLVDPGLVVKVYPCCGLIHSSIDAVLDLRQTLSIEPGDVAEVEVAVHALVPPTMKFDRPATGYEAKFSTPFCIASALRHGAVRLEHFSDVHTRDRDIQDLMGRVTMVVHPDLMESSTFLEREFSEVRITLRDGSAHSRRVARISNRGSRGRPADRALIRDKIEDCIAGQPNAERLRVGFDMLERLETVDDVREIMVYLK